VGPKSDLVKRTANSGNGNFGMTENKNAPIVTPSLIDALDEQFLTEKQLAARHKRSPKTLRNDRGRETYVPFHTFGRLVRYRLSVVIAYEQAHRVACGDEKDGVCAAPTVDPRTETFLTPRELAKRHQREEKTLRNDRVQRSYISYYKFGGQVRHALSDVVAYEQAHRATSTTSAQARAGQQRGPSRLDTQQQDRPHND
jgi:hypothetical protein